MDIQKADPALRRRAIRIVVACTLLMLIAAGGFVWWLRGFSTRLDPAHATGFVLGIRLISSTLAAILLLILGLYVIQRGRRIMADRRFPANDARLVFDTQVREGGDAIRIGKSAVAGGIVTCLSSAILIGFVALSIARIL